MNSESDGKLSNQQLIERNRKPLSAPPPQVTVECPSARECLARMERVLAEQHRINAMLCEIPTRKELAAMQKSLEQALEAMQPPAKKPAGRKSEKHSSNIWRKAGAWLWDHLPKPSLQWLIVIPLGGSVWLALFLMNHILTWLTQVLS